MKFETQDILNGQRNEEKQKENPNSFGELNGSAVVNPDGQMKSKSRMAGQQGQRAMEMMNNPEEQATYCKLDEDVWIKQSRC